MKMRFLFIVLLFSLSVKGQHNSIQKYYSPADTLVQQKLKSWQGLKFGLLMHWGTYSQWGIVESWSLCSEDEGWCERRGPYSSNYDEYKRAYENLQTTFNPTKFNPGQWAKAAKNAGMRYVVFTTKHHDGFCMFNTMQTDYKITSARCPFHSNPKADVTREIFTAFRNEGFMTGAYFSKPDWHNKEYWWPYFATPNRMSNYDPKKYPERWKKYEDFTYKQLEELCTGYGKLDILWLDGGWVRPDSTITEEEKSWINTPWRNEINMHSIAGMARKNQPGILIVDRSVYGYYQNYLTPEQQVPDHPLDYPWETCMTMANSWSYVPGDRYKSSQQLIHLLCRIVSRGGNLLLNIGPSPEGEWDSTAYQRLDEIGKWMQVNSDCIYDTEPVAPYQDGKFVFTKKDNFIYAIYLLEADEKLPDALSFSWNFKNKVKSANLLNEGNVKWKLSDGKMTLHTTKTSNPEKNKFAVVYKIKVN